jgi:DNA-binding transcriptional ArsR family regulator
VSPRSPSTPGAVEVVDPRIIKAMAHPLRYRLLARLNAGEASPVEMARELGEPLGRVSHHVRALARLGAIELVRTRPRRGAVEHFYRAVVPTWFSDEEWARVPRSARVAISGENLGHVLRDLNATGGHGFEHPNSHLSFRWLRLDERAMEEMSELLNATLERALEIEKASTDRDGDGIATEVVLMHFERPS